MASFRQIGMTSCIRRSDIGLTAAAQPNIVVPFSGAGRRLSPIDRRALRRSATQGAWSPAHPLESGSSIASGPICWTRAYGTLIPIGWPVTCLAAAAKCPGARWMRRFGKLTICSKDEP
jgi:hypothetical protein